MDRFFHAYDCTNNLIFFDQYVSDDKKELIKLTTAQYVKMLKTISAPAVIIETNNCKARYYFRAIGWDKTILVGVFFINGIWKINEYFESPSGIFVLSLLKKNLLQGSMTLIQQNGITAMR